MIASLVGQVSIIRGPLLVLDVQGVGYELRCTQGCMANLQVGENARLVVYTEVREDAINLYGFNDQSEKEVFLLLLKVKGVGAKSASEILSNIDKQDLLRCIGSSDVHKLQTVKGVGKKTAERIVVELRDKVAEFIDGMSSLNGKIETINSEPSSDALEALIALGFQRKQAELAVHRVLLENKGKFTTGELVREALRCI